MKNYKDYKENFIKKLNKYQFKIDDIDQIVVNVKKTIADNDNKKFLDKLQQSRKIIIEILTSLSVYWTL